MTPSTPTTLNTAAPAAFDPAKFVKAVLDAATAALPFGTRWAARLLADVLYRKLVDLFPQGVGVPAFLLGDGTLPGGLGAAPAELRAFLSGLFERIIAEAPGRFTRTALRVVTDAVLANLDAVWDNLFASATLKAAQPDGTADHAPLAHGEDTNAVERGNRIDAALLLPVGGD